MKPHGLGRLGYKASNSNSAIFYKPSLIQESLLDDPLYVHQLVTFQLQSTPLRAPTTS